MVANKELECVDTSVSLNWLIQSNDYLVAVGGFYILKAGLELWTHQTWDLKAYTRSSKFKL